MVWSRQSVLSEFDSDFFRRRQIICVLQILQSSESSVFRVFQSSNAPDLQSMIAFRGLSPSESDPELQLLSNSKCSCICSLSTKTLFNTLNFSLWSCKLEHTLAYPIIGLRLCYHQNFRGKYKTHFVSTPLSLGETFHIHCHSFRIKRKIDTIFNESHISSSTPMMWLYILLFPPWKLSNISIEGWRSCWIIVLFRGRSAIVWLQRNHQQQYQGSFQHISWLSVEHRRCSDTKCTVAEPEKIVWVGR